MQNYKDPMPTEKVKELLDTLEYSIQKAKSMPIEPGGSGFPRGQVVFWTGYPSIRIGNFLITDESRRSATPDWIWEIKVRIDEAIQRIEVEAATTPK